MKFRKEIIPTVVAFLNIYYLSSWIYVFNQFESHELRVTSFLKYFLLFSSGHGLDLFLSALTLGSLVFINFKPLKNSYFRLILSAIHIVFLLLLSFSYL